MRFESGLYILEDVMLTFWSDPECFVDCYVNRLQDIGTPGVRSDLLATAVPTTHTHTHTHTQCAEPRALLEG